MWIYFIWKGVVCISVILSFYLGWHMAVRARTLRWKKFYETIRTESVSRESVRSASGYDPFEVVKIVSEKAGIAVPSFYVLRENNSFEIAATFRHKEKSVIVFDEWYLINTSSKMFEGIIAHEIGHIVKNSTIRYLKYGLLGFVYCALYFLAALAWNAIFGTTVIFATVPDETVIGVFSTIAVISLFLSAGCYVLHKVLHRREEYFADRAALSYTRYPLYFLSWLSIMDSINKETYGGAILGELRKIWENFFYNAHPPILKRVKAVKNIMEKKLGHPILMDFGYKA